MNRQEIELNLNLIKGELEREVDPSSISDVQDKLMKLSTYSGLSAELIKETKSLCLYGQRDIVERTRADKLQASILKMKIEGELYMELSLLDYAERLNAAISNSMRALITTISLYKEELNQSKFQNG